MFRNGPWSFERKYDTRSVVGDRYVSVVRSDYMDTGGAHPNSFTSNINIDMRAGRALAFFGGRLGTGGRRLIDPGKPARPGRAATGPPEPGPFARRRRSEYRREGTNSRRCAASAAR